MMNKDDNLEDEEETKRSELDLNSSLNVSDLKQKLIVLKDTSVDMTNYSIVYKEVETMNTMLNFRYTELLKELVRYKAKETQEMKLLRRQGISLDAYTYCKNY